MKKMFVSALFVAFISTGLFAKKAVVRPILDKRICMNISFYYCDSGETFYFNGNQCMDGAFINSEDDFFNQIDMWMSSCD